MNSLLFKKPSRRLAGRFFLLGAVFFSIFSLASPLFAYHILLYYNRFDGTHGGFLHCANALRDAGHQVEVVDVAGENRDPGPDDWGAYDQVWDMRFVDENKDNCGSGSPAAADYFNRHWREKAVDYLRHCGKLFLAAENYQLTDRDEGIYPFLKGVGAVGEGLQDCSPSRKSNSITEDPASYPVLNGLGPVSFWGAFVGGIPINFLTGTSFVQTRQDWQDNDRVERSIASGWKGDQLTGLGEGICARGRLFVVWDATMWSLWNLNLSTSEGRDEMESAKKTTLEFFPAVANWLGGWDCSCGARMERPRPDAESIPRPVSTLSRVETPVSKAVSAQNASRSLLSSALAEQSGSPAKVSGPQTLTFSQPPVNLYMRFADGAGRYQLAVEDPQGRLLEMIWDAPVTAGGEVWASWDGKTAGGNPAGPGLYPAVLFKNGKALRSILLQWLAGSSTSP